MKKQQAAFDVETRRSGVNFWSLTGFGSKIGSANREAAIWIVQFSDLNGTSILWRVVRFPSARSCENTLLKVSMVERRSL